MSTTCESNEVDMPVNEDVALGVFTANMIVTVLDDARAIGISSATIVDRGPWLRQGGLSEVRAGG